MKYDGKILVNTRSIEVVQKILQSSAPPKGEERNILLSFLSIYALSNGLLYDNTVPQKFSDTALECFENWGASKHFTPLRKLIGNDFEHLLSESLNLCTQEMIEVYNSYKKYQPIKDNADVKDFFDYFEKIKAHDNSYLRLEIAYEAYHKNIMGGKLLIAFAHPSNELLLRTITSRGLDEHKKSKLLSGMIGTFRTFLLSNSAVKNDAFFSTEPQFVKLLEKRNKKSWTTLMKEFNSPTKYSNYNSSASFSLKWKSPMIGAAIIIDAAKKSVMPHEIIGFVKTSSSYGKIAQIQKELIKRYTTAANPNDIIKEMEAIWRELLMQNNNTNWKEAAKAGLIYTIAPTIVSGIGTDLYNSYQSPSEAIPEWAVSTAFGAAGLIYQCYKIKTSYLNAISNLSSYSETVDINLNDSFDIIWSNRQ